MCVRLNNLAVLPAAALEEVRGHVKVVEVHEHLDAHLAGVGEELVVVLLALWVDVAICVEESAPLDGRAHRGEPQRLEEHQVIVATVGEVVSCVGANAVVEVLDPEVGPGVPQVLNLAAVAPVTFGLRARHRSAKEEVVGQLVGLLCHRLLTPFPSG